MASTQRSDHKPLNQMLMEAIGPILIIMMVGSLVFLFVEVLYRGPHTARLCWVLGLFTFASVWVARISIQFGTERAAMYGLALSCATFFVINFLVTFEYGGLMIFQPLIILFLIVVVMWSTYKLTWDCTVIDDSRDVSAVGLTEILRQKLQHGKEVALQNLSETSTLENDGSEAVVEAPTKNRGQVFKALFSKRENTPGLWVFYFALFAFPVFGLAQWFVLRNPTTGYRWIFILFTVYLGSALGLLMVTSLLGLERYLAKRNLSVPAPVARNWLAVGSAFAGIVMLLVLLIPRPSSSIGAEGMAGWFTSKRLPTSEWGMGNDGVPDDSGNQAKEQKGNSGREKTRDGAKQAGQGGQNGKTSTDQKQGQGKSNNQGNDDRAKSGRNRNPQDRQKTSQSNRNRSSNDKNQGQRNKGQQNNDQRQDKSSRNNRSEKPSTSDNRQQRNENRADSNERKSDPSREQNESPNRDRQREQKEGSKTGQDRRDPRVQHEQKRERQNDVQRENRPNENRRSTQPNRRSENRPANQPKSNPTTARSLGQFFKWIFYLIGFIALLIVAWLFRKELADFWNSLFARKQKDAVKVSPEDRPVKLPGLETFQDPFASGRYKSMSAANLIQYTFSALEAWARGHNYVRDADETPHEFATVVNGLNVQLGMPAEQLANLVCQASYSEDQEVRREELQPLVDLWKYMKRTSKTGSA